QEMERWKKAEFIILIMAINEERAQKVQQILEDYNMHIPIHREDTPPPPGLPVITIGNIGSGVEMPIYRLAIVTEQELFKKKQKPTNTTNTRYDGIRIKNYRAIKIGDYVVHRNHGIGRYTSIETLKVNQMHKAFILIIYS